MKKLIERFIKFILVPILILVVVIVTSFFGYRAWLQNSIEDRRAINEATGIEILEQVDIGGVKQWIQVRGKDKSNPLLLFLHGGPGSGGLAIAHTFQDAWEEYFTVVQWDQRGAGKSYNVAIPCSSMTLEQMNADTVEIVKYLRKRFGREKIFLLGHSWGSYLGINIIKKHPDWFYAYIGVGQIVNKWEGEKISYKFVLNKAKEQGNNKALQELSSLTPYPSENMVEKLYVQRRWLFKFGGFDYRTTCFIPMIKAALSAPEYSIYDIFNYFVAMKLSTIALWDSFMKINMETLGYDFHVPIFFFSGRHDYTVPAELSHDYFQKIQAPHKEFVWFEDSAHSPMLEEPEKFLKELIKRVLPIVSNLLIDQNTEFL